MQTAPVSAGSVRTRIALMQAVMRTSGRVTRSQYLQTARNASFVVVVRLTVCSICWSTGSGWRSAYVSPGRNRTGMQFAVAVSAAVTMLAAPGPTEDVQAYICLRRFCFAKPIAACAMPCSLRPMRMIRWPGSSSRAWPMPMTLPWPKMPKMPSNIGTSLPSNSTY